MCWHFTCFHFCVVLFEAICSSLIFCHLIGCLWDRGVRKNEDVYSKHLWYRYLLQYKRGNNNNREEKSEDYGKEVQDQINLFFKLQELSSTGYTVSFCWNEINKVITNINFDNRQIRNMLMKKHYKSVMAVFIARLTIFHVIQVIFRHEWLKRWWSTCVKELCFHHKNRFNLSPSLSILKLMFTSFASQ